MKTLLIIFSLVANLPLATLGHEKKPGSTIQNGQTEFNFFENHFVLTRKDSVLVIFDRFDHSGAGIIRKVYYPGRNQSILIPEIPSGKYFVTIQCLGKHHDRFDKVMKIKAGKTSVVSVKLSEFDEYSRDRVLIPVDPVDFSRLSVVTMK